MAARPEAARDAQEALAAESDRRSRFWSIVKNDESKSRLAFTTAKEKLHGLRRARRRRSTRSLKNLGDVPLPQELHAISDKAKMTRLSPVEGIVIQRDAVPGNLYDNNDVLMVIAPLDHLFVWVNVYEADQARVAMNQEMEIRFPYLDQDPGRQGRVRRQRSLERYPSHPDQGLDPQCRRQTQGRHAGAGDA